MPASRPPRPRRSDRPTRDAVTTIREDGSRRFLFPAEVRGKLIRLRRLSAGLLIAIYFSLPWIQIGGHPAVFLDVAGRRFHLFGSSFAFQDIWLMFFAVSGLGFALFFVTALLGRVWCGWACPQTIFLEHVYRRIEYWIEGDSLRRRQLATSGWTRERIVKCALKHTAFALASAAIAHLFLAYFVSIPALWSMMRAAPVEHADSFLFIAIFAGVLYFNFGWFREQLCLIICPYGRLQSALIDDHSLVIGYDSKRGEPRGKAGTEGAGDCVDCNRCVQVCPTGIDIRHGLQMECIGCTACIDACNDVMGRLGRPSGLIRYDSLAGLDGGKTRWWRPRTAIYGVLLLAGGLVAGWGFSTIKPASLGITRLAGAPYYQDSTYVRNQFLIRLVNKSHEPLTLSLELKDVPTGLVVSGFENAAVLPALGEEVVTFVVQQTLRDYRGQFPMQIQLSDSQHKFVLEKSVDFLGPDPGLLKMLSPAP